MNDSLAAVDSLPHCEVSMCMACNDKVFNLAETIDLMVLVNEWNVGVV